MLSLLLLSLRLLLLLLEGSIEDSGRRWDDNRT